MNVQSGALSCAVQGGAREMEDKGKVKEPGDQVAGPEGQGRADGFEMELWTQKT